MPQQRLRTLLLAVGGAKALAAAPTPPLPAINVDPASVTVSGISSGADFAVNLHVAHSSIIRGVGVFAGQAYHCAVTRFPRDQLLPPSDNVPVCDGCPPNTTLQVSLCLRVDVTLCVYASVCGVSNSVVVFVRVAVRSTGMCAHECDVWLGQRVAWTRSR
jgi:hypothetical protein